MGIQSELEKIRNEFEGALMRAGSLKDIEDIKVKYLGRKGDLTGILKAVATLPKEERREAGKQANLLKNELTEKLGTFTSGKKTEMSDKREALDVTMPGISSSRGTLHPLTQVMEKINDIFVSLGFSIAEGPEIESEFYNFEALNIPLDHPSRDAFDTFYVDEKHLLRSHTSNVQIHVMEKKDPPVQVIMPGRVYRPDAVDASHSFMFHQVEGLMVDKDVTFADLKGVLSVFCKSIFGENIKMRLRPHFFPFTEPSAEVDISCIICGGKGCRVCSGNGWLEILGAGMVNPKVFKSVGYDPDKYTGFAFGMGVERIAMLLYGIEDIRLFYENDVRFLKQFD